MPFNPEVPQGYAIMYVHMYVCMYVRIMCVYVCMYVCMYVRMYVCVCVMRVPCPNEHIPSIFPLPAAVKRREKYLADDYTTLIWTRRDPWILAPFSFAARESRRTGVKAA